MNTNKSLHQLNEVESVLLPLYIRTTSTLMWYISQQQLFVVVG